MFKSLFIQGFSGVTSSAVWEILAILLVKMSFMFSKESLNARPPSPKQGQTTLSLTRSLTLFMHCMKALRSYTVYQLEMLEEANYSCLLFKHPNTRKSLIVIMLSSYNIVIIQSWFLQPNIVYLQRSILKVILKTALGIV